MNDTEDKTRLISLTEAAELYGFSVNYLRNVIKRGRMSGKKIAGVWLTTPESVELFIKSRQNRGVFREDIEIPD